MLMSFMKLLVPPLTLEILIPQEVFTVIEDMRLV